MRAKVSYDDLPPMVLSLLQAWRDEAPALSFQDWTAGKPDAALAALCDRVAAEA